MNDSDKIDEQKSLYDGVRGKAVKLLNRIDKTDAYLDKLLEVEMRNSELSGRDKALLYEIVHGVVRWMGRLDWILTGFYKGQFAKIIPNIKNAMRVALYQILFLDKVPDYAAVNDAVEFAKRFQGQKSADIVNGVLRSIIRSKDGIRYADRNEDLILFLSAYYSHPSWLVKRWVNRWGEEFTEKLMNANNNRPKHTIRVNRLVTSVTEMEKLLEEIKQKYYKGRYLKNFLKLASLNNITDWKYFKMGYFSIQDESTGIPVKLLEPQPGMKVLDLCAAPGGKS
ncbi:MAG: 16S rRNA (cytosine(967)-C(5))-methyltransferase RsmB, partial [Ignavibacteria bacterium]